MPLSFPHYPAPFLSSFTSLYSAFHSLSYLSFFPSTYLHSILFIPPPFPFLISSFITHLVPLKSYLFSFCFISLSVLLSLPNFALLFLSSLFSHPPPPPQAFPQFLLRTPPPFSNHPLPCPPLESPFLPISLSPQSLSFTCRGAARKAVYKISSPCVVPSGS